MKIKMTDIITLAALLLLGLMLILNSAEVSRAVSESAEACIYRIIPSLFAMTVVSTAVSRSGIVPRLLRRTRIDPDIFTAFVFGNIGGYPVGTKLLCEAANMKRLTPLQASEALSFCYACGPAFAAGVAGTALFGDIRFGLAALVSVVLANLTLYIVYIIKNRSSKPAAKTSYEGFSTKLMTDSVSSSFSAMMNICSMILFFSALRAVLQANFPVLRSGIFSSLLEISNISELDGKISLITVALLLAFGGICVHMQIIAMISGRFSVKRFYLTRLIQLPLCGLYAFIIQSVMKKLGIAAFAATKIRLSRSPSLIPVICVAAMVAITLIERAKALSRRSF